MLYWGETTERDANYWHEEARELRNEIDRAEDKIEELKDELWEFMKDKADSNCGEWFYVVPPDGVARDLFFERADDEDKEDLLEAERKNYGK